MTLNVLFRTRTWSGSLGIIVLILATEKIIVWHCKWQKSTVFPYYCLLIGEMTRNDTYLKQMLLYFITIKDGKSYCSQAVNTCRGLSWQFISCPAEGTESLTLVDGCQLSYSCFQFPFQNSTLNGLHTYFCFNIATFFFSHFLLILCFCCIFISILPSRSHLLIFPFCIFSHFHFLLLHLVFPLFSFPLHYFCISLFSYSLFLISSTTFSPYSFLPSTLIKHLTI